MSGRTYAADDRDAISERLAASFKCCCLPVVADDGSTDWKLTPDCPLHRVAAAAESPVAALAQRYPHWGASRLIAEQVPVNLQGPVRGYCSCPVGPDGIVHLGGCELHRADGFTYTAPSPEYRAQIIARIRATLDSARIPKLMSAAHFRVGR